MKPVEVFANSFSGMASKRIFRGRAPKRCARISVEDTGFIITIFGDDETCYRFEGVAVISEVEEFILAKTGCDRGRFSW